MNQTTRVLPPPYALGLPDRFQEWRAYQDSAIYDIAESTARFVMAVLPTGAGKSVLYITLAALLGCRTVILTRTKALQRQLSRDFESMGLADIAGMNAYRCTALQPGGELYQHFDADSGDRKFHHSCEDGPCRLGVDCTLKMGGCSYYDAIKAARGATIVSTNYAYWMAANKFGQGLGHFGLIVLDEAHDAPDALSDFLTVNLEPWELASARLALPDGQLTHDQWRLWASGHHEEITKRVEQLTAAIHMTRDSGGKVTRAVLREAKLLQSLISRLALIKDLSSEWICYPSDKGKWTFTPAWPARYAESILFSTGKSGSIPKVLLTSATVRRKTASYLGISDAGLDVLEYPSVFPPERRPVYYIPTVRMRYGMPQDDWDKWVRQIDNIIRGRLDRKGILHTVSYKRAQEVLVNSQYAKHMISHSSSGTLGAIERFKAADPPAILVSPAVGEGHDFPYEEAEFVIIGKIPYPVTTDPVLIARQAKDKDYGGYLAMQGLVQAAGRGMRAEDDLCEVFILDDLWVPYKKRYSDFIPQWFLETLQRRTTIPLAPPKLRR